MLFLGAVNVEKYICLFLSHMKFNQVGYATICSGYMQVRGNATRAFNKLTPLKILQLFFKICNILDYLVSKR